MIIKKITYGFVVQVFDDSKKMKKFISQEFVAGDQCEYENEGGMIVDPSCLEVDGQEVYLPFDMVQPK